MFLEASSTSAVNPDKDAPVSLSNSSLATHTTVILASEKPRGSSNTELFTGNAMVMLQGLRQRTVSAGQVAAVWGASLAGNLVGSIALAGVVHGGGTLTGPGADLVATVTADVWYLPGVATPCGAGTASGAAAPIVVADGSVASALSAVRLPSTTVSPAVAKRRASPRPCGPVPPRTAMVWSPMRGEAESAGGVVSSVTP